MNVNDMLNELAGRGVDMCAVYTGNGNPEDRYAIVKVGLIWHVYYSERGEKREWCQFQNENEACEYLKHLLNKDETVWK